MSKGEIDHHENVQNKEARADWLSNHQMTDFLTKKALAFEQNVPAKPITSSGFPQIELFDSKLGEPTQRIK